MRKIERQLKEAWKTYTAIHLNNSSVQVDGGKRTLTLFGNVIAVEAPGEQLRFTLAGWNTSTTRSRLFNVLDLPIRQVEKQPCACYLEHDQILDPRAWYSVTADGMKLIDHPNDQRNNLIA